MKVLVIGASGFIGTHIVKYAVSQKHQVVAGVRKSSSTDHLHELQVPAAVFSYDSDELLSQEIAQLKQLYGKFDLIIHNAGLTKAFDPKKLFTTNQLLTVKMAELVEKQELLSAKGKFVYVSSLAARGPYGVLKPVTNYGRSKLLAEEQLLKMSLPVVIVRPTAVFGPGDAAFLKLFKAIKMNIAPLLAKPTQQLTFIFARDLARLLVDYAPAQPDKTIIAATDGKNYSPGELYSCIGDCIAKKPVTIRIPSFIMMPYAHANEFFAKIFKGQPVLTPEKMNELTADWGIAEGDITPKDFIFTSLSDALKESAEHYRQNGLL
ncbi:MAG: NAD(P)-dependent oxidoreductase [Imperialibacter sp.]|uniref:NAD-dependent epimerase/dehydratase family protein n=1 Tax=Imperialibacter sp. TaxID=2038411 RepID=UPI0032EE922C